MKTTGACTDDMAQKANGKWIKTTDLGSINSKERYKRLDAVHELILKIYPEPKGVDAVWHRAAGVSYFGSKRKYYKSSGDRFTFDYLNTPHFYRFYYSGGFFAYRSYAYNRYVLQPGYPLSETMQRPTILFDPEVTLDNSTDEDNKKYGQVAKGKITVKSFVRHGNLF